MSLSAFQIHIINILLLSGEGKKGEERKYYLPFFGIYD